MRLPKLFSPAGLFILAFVLRLVPVVAAISLPIGLDDMFQYDMLGRSLAAGEGYRWYAQPDLDLIRSYIDIDFIAPDYDPRGIETSFRAPAYPFLLAGVYTISGLEWRLFAARLVNAALGALLAPMTYALARRLFPDDERVARFGGLALAAYPMLLIYPLALATENLFFPLMLGGLLALLRAAEKQRARDWLLAGAILGAATLTRSVIFAFAGLAGLWIWFGLRNFRAALLYGLAVFALVLPWTIRNTLLEGQFTFVENSMGYNLHMGYHPQGSGTFQYGISVELLPYLDDGERNTRGTQMALGYIQDDPGRVPSLIVSKLGYFFGLERRAISYFYTNNFFGNIPTVPLVAVFLLFTLPFPIISTLAAAGLPFVRWNRERILTLLLLGGYILPHILLMAEDRFHLAILPVLAVYAGHAWAQRRELAAAARRSLPRALAAALLVGLLWLNWGLELHRDSAKLAQLFGPDGNRAGFSY
ncbi:MAG: glycosyltransferase family 39 protein [Anaerolineales bacterium]|nr:MAG: glycosyltransferase family 39 protein [Anaerolineales bacterium]